MSGTSCDGIDAALVELEIVDGRIRVTEQGARTYRYRRHTRNSLLGAGSSLTVERLARLHFVLGNEFATAAQRLLQRLEIAPDAVDFIASHGHTVYHGPNDRVSSTLQIGQPALIAAGTGISTIADFRAADIASGGEGAPLTPHVNRILFGHPRRVRAIHNLGGISNVTVLGGGKVLSAFDTGPANMLIDAVVRDATRGRLGYDHGGRLARRGEAHQEILAELLRHPYFRRRPPKSTGREVFGDAYSRQFLERCRKLHLPPADRVATATALTAASIERAYRDFVLPATRVDEIYFSGGGARNTALVSLLERRLDFAEVATIEALGLSPDFLEAVSFAVLGLETLLGRKADLRDVTGADRPAMLGCIYPGANWNRLRRRLVAAR